MRTAEMTDDRLELEAARLDDETTAEEFSWVLNGAPDEAAAHLQWLRAVARNLVVRRWYQIEALAAALLERTVLDGDTATSLIHNAQKGASNA